MTKEKTTKLTTINEVLNSIQLNLKAPKDQKNTFGNYNYRKAEDILEAVKEELKKDIYPRDCVIGTNINLKSINNRTFLCCVANLQAFGSICTGKAYAELELSKKGMDLAQLTGAATSYAKKYALGNLFAIDDSKDDPDSKDNTKEEPKTPLGKVADSLDDGMAETIYDFLSKEIQGCETLAELEHIKIKNKQSFTKLAKIDKKRHEAIITIGSAKRMSLEMGDKHFDDNVDDIGR